MPELMTVHDIMLAAGNAAFNEARAAAIRLAEQFECGALVVTQFEIHTCLTEGADHDRGQHA
jgi:hypothetical protein